MIEPPLEMSPELILNCYNLLDVRQEIGGGLDMFLQWKGSVIVE